MIESTVLFQEAIERDSRSFRARFLIGSQVVEGDVRSVTVHKGSTGESEFNPGAVFCSYIEAVVDNCSEALEGRELQLQIGIMTNTDLENPVYEYLRIGMFRVRKPSTSRHRTTFTAHGRIASSMNGLFTPPQTMTLAAVASAITSQTGVLVQFASGIDTSLPIRGSLEDMTCREALSVIASVVGGYATETAAGDVIIRPFETTVTAEYTQDVMTELPTFADYDTEITGVEVIVLEPGYDEDGEETEGISYTYGDPVNVEISNPYMTEQAFAAFRSSIVGLTYRSGHVPLALGDPRIEPWDTVQVTTVDEDIFVVPCMEIAIIYDGGLQTTVDAPGLQDETQVEGSLAKAVRTAAAAGAAAANARRAAEQAEADADTAASAATAAQNSASAAQASASSAASSAAAAQSSARSAASSAEQARQDASSAASSATQANVHANSALTQLSVVEDVLDVLGWISKHATYKASTDPEVEPGKYYFIRSGSGTSADPYTYSVVSTPTGSPAANSYYELDRIDEAVSNYVSTHLALDNAGLWVIKDSHGYKILLANDGLKVYDAAGNLVSTFGENITLSSLRSQYIGGENAYIVFNAQDGSINIGGSRVTIGGSKTLTQMLDDIAAAVTNVEVQYAAGTSPTEAPESGWSASTPIWQEGQYIWQRTATTKNGTTAYSNTACIQGAAGSDGQDGEDATLLKIDSSRGVLFKSNNFSTVLTVTIYKGGKRITNASAMHAEYGAGAYLQWYWRKFDDSDWRTMLVSDSHITDDGFTLTITPDDVDEKIVFKCDLIV